MKLMSVGKMYSKAFASVFLSFAMFAVSSVALGKVQIRDVTLQNTFLDRSALTAEIVGELTNSCDEVDNIDFTLSPALTTNKEINLYVEGLVGEDLGMCRESPKAFIKSVELGMLEPGYYTLRIFENNSPAFSKGVSIPFDVKTAPLGIDFNRALGETRQKNGGQKS